MDVTITVKCLKGHDHTLVDPAAVVLVNQGLTCESYIERFGEESLESMKKTSLMIERDGFLTMTLLGLLCATGIGSRN